MKYSIPVDLGLFKLAVSGFEVMLIDSSFLSKAFFY